MNHTNYLVTKLTDDALWQHLQLLLQEHSPATVQKHEDYLCALRQLESIGGDAQTLDQAYRSAIVSDALFAFQKGMEANRYHFRHPQVPSFAQVDFEDMYQEWVMMNMPKRLAAEKISSSIEGAYFRTDLPWCKTIREYIIDMEVTIPKMMHFEGYKAGNSWFALTVPGYHEDQALTSIYAMQIHRYFAGQ